MSLPSSNYHSYITIVTNSIPRMNDQHDMLEKAQKTKGLTTRLLKVNAFQSAQTIQ